METAARPTGIATVSVGDGAWPDIGNDAPNHTSTTCSTGMEDTEGPGWPGYGAGGRWQGLQDNEPTSTTHQHTDPTGVGSAGGSGGHGWPGPTAPGIPARQGCGARGWRQGLARHRKRRTEPHVNNLLHRHGEHRRTRKARPRCRWAVARPGHASRRRAEPHQSPRLHRCGERRKAWLRCPWATEPGQTSETTHRATLAARTASRRAAAHGHRHTKQPDPATTRNDYDSETSVLASPATPSPRASRRARPR